MTKECSSSKNEHADNRSTSLSSPPPLPFETYLRKISFRNRCCALWICSERYFRCKRHRRRTSGVRVMEVDNLLHGSKENDFCAGCACGVRSLLCLTELNLERKQPPRNPFISTYPFCCEASEGKGKKKTTHSSR